MDLQTAHAPCITVAMLPNRPARRILAVLLDLSGTLHIGDDPVDGAAEAVARLRAARVAVRFVSNTTKESRQSLLARLNGGRLRLGVSPDDLFTSLSAGARVVQSRRLRPLLLVSDSALEEFGACRVHDAPEAPNAVVVGLAPERMTYDNLNAAFRIVRDGGPLIALHKGRYYAAAPGVLSLGPGAFVAALEYAASTAAEVVGKPAPAFFGAVLADCGCAPEDAAMIGDDAVDDAAGAAAAGLWGMLVRTGKYAPGDEARAGVDPGHVFDGVGEAVDAILRHNAAVDALGARVHH